jgi:uncharacterized protein DUF1629
MSSVYVPYPSEGFELCQPLKQEDFETINVRVNGEHRKETWHPIAMQLIREDEGERLAPSDSPWLGSHALVFKRATLDALGAELRKHGELLPLLCSEEELVVFNPTRILDALDQKRSSVQRFNSGRIMRVSRYAFRPEAIEGVEVFKIPDLRVSPTFVSSRIVRLWTDARLKGLEFKRIWEPN